ncbi:RDD family protein [Azotosporobacter soli]|uniref:RDD family protein n=1 Tax=Azotosporobacter soli TaxID=3055040 RepID=UPI0031FF41E5
MNEKYGGAGVRFLASLIDFAVIVILSTLLFLGCMKGVEVFVKEISIQHIIGTDVTITAIVYMTYFTVLEGGKRQAGLGKRMMKLKVTGLDNTKIGYVAAFCRAILKLILVLGFAGVGAISIFFSKKKQTVYDIFLKTVVKKTNERCEEK